MDVLLSLPIASYFLAPAVTSWSTSMNLLFFYMTWSTLILSHPPLRIELMGVFALRLVLWLIPSLVFLLLDTLLPSLVESIKFGGSSALPRRDVSAIARRTGLAILNLALAVGLEAGISVAYTSLLSSPIFKTSTTLPLPWQIIKHVLMLLAARETLTYYLHRYVLHSGKTSLSKLHMQYAHNQAVAPHALMLFADHPLPLFLHRIIPVYLPSLILRPHLLTYFIFVALATLEETLAMSGYSIVPGIVMGGIARRTSIHYASRGRGNFGAWGFLDWINGTGQGPDVIDDVRAEAEKHNVKGRSQNAANSTISMVQEGVNGFRKTRSRGRRSVKQESAAL
jgi:hypothetical protein